MHQFNQWKAALQQAGTAEEVQAVMTEYVSQLAPGDKIDLPTACKTVLHDIDIPTGAVICVREELRFNGDPYTRDLLHEIAHTFVAAANRLAYITSAQKSPDGANDVDHDAARW